MKTNIHVFAKRIMAGALAAVTAAVLFTGCSSGSSQSAGGSAAAPAQSTAKKTFKIALECAYAPYNWTQTDNSNGAVPIQDSNTYCNGYDIQIAKKIADSMGCELQVYKTEWTAIPTAITSGKVDAGICGMTVTAERKKTLLFSDPYYTSSFVVLVRKDGKFANAKSLSDLKGAACTSQQSTAWYDLLSQIPGGNVQPALTDVPTMLVSLTSGKSEVLSCDKPTGMAAVKAYSNLKMIEFADGNGFQVDEEQTHVCAALALNNTELQGKINTALKSISTTDQAKTMQWAVDHQPAT
ncbi:MULTISPECIES: transporter substrate-binding domain-containing protein [Caproicibacterium]|uniref:Transporter substrate-binding domain-containing protein n=1 Tax=Caproicibacterium argilliputei TaxID=3030016 RepID=A0AA97D7G7_9FIRM|nr:transporter substrate-binding domain-containing protein [Caproicibacterium argilliputei]WOC31744.1 transporter substrate-binding domain-containing protein [Caproicibacterium argilliputei]